VAVSTITDTQLGYLSCVTSSIQTQLDRKGNQATTYSKTEVDNLVSALTADATDLRTTDTNLQSSISSHTNSILKLSNVVALSASTPEVYLQIPAGSFIGVRKSDISGNIVSCNGSGATFNSPIVSIVALLFQILMPLLYFQLPIR